MKRIIWFLIGLLLLVGITAAQAQGFSEARFQAIFARDSIIYNDMNLSDTFKLDRNSVLKEISIGTILDRQYRLKYSAILPNSKTGNGVLLKPLLVNNILFGPKDSQGSQQNTQDKPVTLDTSFQSHRFEVDLLAKMPTFFQPKIFGEYLIGSIKVTGKATDGQGGDVVEAKDSYHKFLFGLGAVGYQRQDPLMAKYEVAYTFADSGWFVDLGGRYRGNALFVGAGWRYEKHKVFEYQGPYVDMGLMF